MLSSSVTTPLGVGVELGHSLPSLTSLSFRSPCFEEEEHFKVLVRMSAQELSNGIPDSGHLYAALRAGKTLTPAGDLQETFSGMDQVGTSKATCWS